MAALNFPASPAVNQIYTANLVSYQWDGTTWKGIGVSQTAPFGFSFTKTPVASKLLAVFDSPVPWIIPASLAGSQGTIVANDMSPAGAPSAQTDFDIQSPPGTSVGTMRIAASSLVATFIFASTVTVPLGQITQIVCPASLNGMTGAITGSVVGTR